MYLLWGGHINFLQTDAFQKREFNEKRNIIKMPIYQRYCIIYIIKISIGNLLAVHVKKQGVSY